MNAKTIPVYTAATWTKRWQQEHPYDAKAFLIPIDDLIDSMEEMDIIIRNPNGSFTIRDIEGAGIRAYMAIDPDEKVKEARGEKLLIVGTKRDEYGIHRDIIQFESNNAATAPEGSGVFNFTTPCPSECDPDSPLY